MANQKIEQIRNTAAIEMIDITSSFLAYRNCIRNLWNDHFIKQAAHATVGETSREYYDHIKGTLFTALIALKEFGKPLQAEQDIYYNEIQVQPGIGPLGYRCMYAKIENEEYIWDYVWIKTEANSFKFIDYFDWVDEEVMDCQFAEVVLVASEEFPELIGTSFLFDAASVKYWKIV